MTNEPRLPKSEAQLQLTSRVRRLVPHVGAVWAEIFVEDTDDFWNTIRVRNPGQGQNAAASTVLKAGDQVTITVTLARSEKVALSHQDLVSRSIHRPVSAKSGRA